MGLEDKRDAFDGGRVGTFAAFGEALFDEFFSRREQGDTFASLAFAAEVVFQTLAIGGLREHARQREFAEAAWPAEEQSMGNTIAAQGAAEGGDEAFIAEEFGEAHGSAAFLGEGFRKDGRDGGENVGGDALLRAHCVTRFV